MYESFINYNVKEGSGVKLGDLLRQKNNQVEFISKIIGFDSSGCPFIEYKKVVYKTEDAIPNDPIEVGDVMPFAWSNPAQYKMLKFKNKNKFMW